jgi:hypothetical protein
MEKILTPEVFDEATLVNEIYTLRDQSDAKMRWFVDDSIFKFIKSYKKELMETYGSTQLLQQVPAFQAMIGGTLELERGITPEQRTSIVKRIQTFVVGLQAELDGMKRESS